MSAPSFSSFPPSFGSFPEDPSNEPGPSRPRDDSKHRKHSHREKDSKKETTREKVKKYRREHRDRKSTEADEVSETRFFYSDRRGDPLNLQYGSLHKGDVPRYKCINRGRNVLGLPPNLTVLYRGPQGIEIGMHRRNGPSLTDSKARNLVTSAPTRRILGHSDRFQLDETGFLRISSIRERSQQSYRSITGGSHSESSSGSEGSAAEDSDISEEDADTVGPTTVIKTLEQQLSDDPSSVATWLQLLWRTLSNVPIASKNSARVRAEITISILSRALSSDVRNTASKPLRLKYLRAGEEIWTKAKVQEEWEDAFKLGGIEIWMEWLEWKIRNETNGIDHIVDVAKRVLDALGDDEVSKVRVFWRSATALRAAGFVERATALFQAQAELTFELPQALYGLPMSSILDALEEFWESEVSRFGEPGSKGWAHWVSSGKKGEAPALASTPPPSDDSDPYRRWARIEFKSDRATYIPSRATEEDDWDPYSTIMFSDIRPLLLQLQTTHGKDVFRLTWLSFLGLHVPGFSDSPHEANWDDRWNCMHLTNPGYLNAVFPDETRNTVSADSYSGVLVGREIQYARGSIPVKCWGYGVLGPLDDALSGDGLCSKIDLDGLDQEFTRRVLNQLRLGPEDHEWDLITLAFEAASSVKSALKISRIFLSTARDSLPHWAGHACLERKRGRFDEASKNQPWSGRLWWDWTEMEWLDQKSDAAMSVIFKAASVAGQGGVAILRAKRNLDDISNHKHSAWKDKEAWVKLRALLELLTSDDLTQSLLVFDQSMHEAVGVAHESMTVASLLFIFRHGCVLKRPMTPSILRDRAGPALRKYPSNSIIFRLGQGIWGRVRDMLGENPGEEKDVCRRIEEVWVAKWQSGRWEGEIERTRSGLAAAVESEASLILWRIYIEFEIRAGQLQKAKKLLFRAIGECPLAKDLYLLAFDHLRSVFSAHELHTFVNTMGERGIRMRQELDVQIQSVEAGGSSDDAEDSGKESEIERNARELRRLKPY
ncbi:NRDE-2, necessary for RNA interference-domain-containing protein [Desarmillaria tabescens]|uniref:NRDE-2, necessary for RNA interference-domain-containing protein n=1 Tax=Armillaria tabescens TaxID=1929756 RepID=A0AA39TNC9_ARMTA|nr:NRDE-2, necessary for RNA interference-domain-containing protein [Desarmillaria tabescens]KAK0464952.1 NRDE-2, necessary for RNA interference-domain-containing protein [Desarmillaria tabescens]